MTALEICVEDPAGICAAIAGGADRIELCSALALGGLTPSPALLAIAAAHAAPAGVTVHAMVRPRAGDFAYDPDSVELALAEGEALVEAGADGLVFGASVRGALDRDVLARWVDRFGGRESRTGVPIELSLHRAIDLVRDHVAAVEQAIALSFHRILSSGGAVRAPDGAPVLAAMVAQAAGRCRIAAASGVRADNVAALLAATGVDEVHASASCPIDRDDPALAALGFAAGQTRTTSRDAVAALRSVIKPS